MKGQSIIEIIIVFGIAFLLLAGLVTGVTLSIKNVQFARNKSQAVKYAQEGLEIARSLRDQDWTSFTAKTGILCLNKAGSWSSGSCVKNIDNFFTRSVDFKWNVTFDQAEVTVIVSWTEGNLTHQSQLVSYLTKWR